jgi:hypothetical protein
MRHVMMVTVLGVMGCSVDVVDVDGVAPVEMQAATASCEVVGREVVPACLNDVREHMRIAFKLAGIDGDMAAYIASTLQVGLTFGSFHEALELPGVGAILDVHSDDGDFGCSDQTLVEHILTVAMDRCPAPIDGVVQTGEGQGAGHDGGRKAKAKR